VRNLSKRSLSSDEEKVLALGLNYAVQSKTIPTGVIIAATEATAKQLDSRTAETLRSKISRALQTSKPPRCNLPGHLLQAVKHLRTNESIVILPADKGNATVGMDRAEYEGKIETMLADGTYKKLRTDPTTKVERKIDAALK